MWSRPSSHRNPEPGRLPGSRKRINDPVMSMSKPPSDVVKNLVATLDEAVDLLEDFSSGNRAGAAREQDLGSLVEQCMALCAAPQLRNTEPVRIVHHFACTGGTMLCKCIAARPNTQLLSEVRSEERRVGKESGGP